MSRKPRFDVGLVMAGAVSGGAYQAGVVDFLIQALDEWEKARGDATPGAGRMVGHEVSLRCASGASAGSITTALLARVAAAGATPVRDPQTHVEAAGSVYANPLFGAWVESIDIRHLLGTKDLPGSDAVPVSVLDSSALPGIAANALRSRGARGRPSWLADPFEFFLTIANLRGVPFTVAFNTVASADHYMTLHADYLRFGLTWDAGVAATHDGIALHAGSVSPDEESWAMLLQGALASGAFPLGLAPRELRRKFDAYDRRDWSLSFPSASGATQIKPHWPSAVGAKREAEPDWQYDFVNVDGGAMNNEPFELVRKLLAAAGSATPDAVTGELRNERSGARADAAVLMIDPFPNFTGVSVEYEPRLQLLMAIFKLLGAYTDQARFKPEEFVLALRGDVYSRFLISPSSSDDAGRDYELPMAANALGGFGGFFAREYRVHDFHLGRRNCQAFLARHFTLPENNERVIAPWFGPLSAADQAAVLDTPGFGPPAPRDGRTREVPIIPLCGSAREPIAKPPRPRADAVDFAALEDQIRARMAALVPCLINGIPPLARFRPLLRAAWFAARMARLHARLADDVVKAVKEEFAHFDRVVH